MSQSERKFKQGLTRPGSAALVRETVSQTVRENEALAKPKVVDPLDYETYVLKKKNVIDSDPDKNMLTFPSDDVAAKHLPRRYRTMRSTVPPCDDVSNLFVRECIKSYSSSWNMVHYKYQSYSGNYLNLPKQDTHEDLISEPQVFEVDIETEKIEQDTGSLKRTLSKTVTKSGFLYILPDRHQDTGFSKISSKALKRRFFYLKQQLDTSYVLEYHKDDKKLEAKGTIYLDSLVDVIKTSKRKCGFDLVMQEKVYTLSADTDAEVDSWIKILKTVIENERRSLSSEVRNDDSAASPCHGLSMSESLKQSLHPELQKYARETEESISEAREEARKKLFGLYKHEMSKGMNAADQQEPKVDFYGERFGLRLLVKCENFAFKLLANLPQGDRHTNCQVEPYFTTLALYDLKSECKISEDFHFDINDPRVRDMIPKDVLMAPEMLNAVDETDRFKPSLGTLNEDWLQFRNQAIFSVMRPNKDIYLVIRIEKVLHGNLSQCVEPYISKNCDTRLGLKVHKQMQGVCQRLGHYRMPFAWTARPVFKPFSGEVDTHAEFTSIFRQDTLCLTDTELIKYLGYLSQKRADKLSKLIPIPGAVKLNMEELRQNIPNCLSPSMVPVKPFPEPPTNPISYEMEEFLPESADSSFPHTTYANNLYICPLQLKFDTQKAFTKARNIACVIQFRDSDTAGAVPLKRIYGRPGMPAFVTTATTAVQHHNTAPEFYEEVKVALPLQLHCYHHILLTFYHVSCEPPKATMKKKDTVETVVGYAWLPILRNGVVSVDQHNVSIAQELPSGYLNSDAQGFGKGYSGPIIKWVENGRPLLMVNLRLASTVYTKDPHLQRFFAHCEKLEMSEPNDSTETSNLLKKTDLKSLVEMAIGDFQREVADSVKALHAVDVSTFIKFLPPILNQVFRILTSTASDDVAQNAVRLLIHIVHVIHVAGKPDILNSYVKHVFVTTPESNNKKTVHEELAKNLSSTLRPANADLILINNLLGHSWFFFEIIIKSMAQHLIDTEKIKFPRNERFPSDFQFRVQTLVQALVQHIMQKYKDNLLEIRSANINLANFVKRCFTFMDRGFVMKLINLYMDKVNPSGSKMLFEYKFEFLRIVCNHEHYVALNLPLVRPTAIKNIKADLEIMEKLAEYYFEFFLTDEFRTKHFLSGLLLIEVKFALKEYREIRKMAIATICNLFAKHAFDDRYSSRRQQSKIVSLYLPFLGILLENVNRLTVSQLQRQDSTATTTSRMSMVSITSLPNGDASSLSDLSRLPPTPTRNSIASEAKEKSASLLREPLNLTLIADGSVVSNAVPAVTRSDSDSSGSSTATLQDGEGEGSENRSHSRSQSVQPSSAHVIRYDKLDRDEQRDLLICFLYILENISAELLLGWWQNCSDSELLDFFRVLELSLLNFRYLGKKKLHMQQAFSVISGQKKSQTLPNRKTAPLPPIRTVSTYSDKPGVVPISDEVDTYTSSLAANMCTEVGLIILDTVALFTSQFKNQLQFQSGDNTLMRRVFDIYMLYLQTGQSEKLLKHVFAALRCFVNKYTISLFEGSALLCGSLIYETLKCCNSKLSSIRNDASALLYLLTRSNFEYTGARNFTRVHLQTIVSVSQLLGDSINLNNERFRESLSNINNYAISDKAMKSTPFPSEVKDLTKRIRTVLEATAQMKEHENDPEMLVDLQYSLANSYASTPELRLTWLENMARIHVKDGNLSEAAHCHVHIAALVAEYLKRKGIFPQGCAAFGTISPNIVRDESNMKDDAGMQDVQYTEDTLQEKLEMCAYTLDQAERWEVMGEVYKLIIPIHEKHRNYRALAEAYHQLHLGYNKIVSVMQSGKRLLGTFFKVAFYGSLFEADDRREYIYKEPKLTRLSEISERLEKLYTDKFSKDTVKILDSSFIEPTELDPKYAYIQISFVTPYFKDDDEERITDFEKSNNIRHFMYETPFTLDGTKSRGSLEEQCKRRTILTTAYSFPYVKKRVPVENVEVLELSPIEVAIDEMRNRVIELNEVIRMDPPDMIKLQLRLQGSVSVQVHAGPMAYCNTFLAKPAVNKYPTEHVRGLKEMFRLFVQACREALDINEKLIGAEQLAYHKSMKNNYNDMTEKLSVHIEKVFGARQSPVCRPPPSVARSQSSKPKRQLSRRSRPPPPPPPVVPTKSASDSCLVSNDVFYHLDGKPSSPEEPVSKPIDSVLDALILKPYDINDCPVYETEVQTMSRPSETESREAVTVTPLKKKMTMLVEESDSNDNELKLNTINQKQKTSTTKEPRSIPGVCDSRRLPDTFASATQYCDRKLNTEIIDPDPKKPCFSLDHEIFKQKSHVLGPAGGTETFSSGKCATASSDSDEEIDEPGTRL